MTSLHSTYSEDLFNLSEGESGFEYYKDYKAHAVKVFGVITGTNVAPSTLDSSEAGKNELTLKIGSSLSLGTIDSIGLGLHAGPMAGGWSRLLAHGDIQHTSPMPGRLADKTEVSVQIGPPELIWSGDTNAQDEAGWTERDKEKNKVNNNLAELKIFYSNIARYQSMNWRAHIFHELDRLLRFDAWGPEAALVKTASFVSFSKFLVFAQPERLPGMAVSVDGNITAGWKSDERSVVVEFKLGDMASALVVKVTTRGKQKAAWQGNVGSLKDFLSAFGNWDCLNEKKITT